MILIKISNSPGKSLAFLFLDNQKNEKRIPNFHILPFAHFYRFLSIFVLLSERKKKTKIIQRSSRNIRGK